MPSLAAEVCPGPAGGEPAGLLQRGMVTAELAFASLGAAIGCVAMAWVLAVLGLAIRCQDTAAEVARQEARGDQDAVSRAIADAPAGARVEVRSARGMVQVRVEASARPFAGWLPPLGVGAQASVLREPQ